MVGFTHIKDIDLRCKVEHRLFLIEDEWYLSRRMRIMLRHELTNYAKTTQNTTPDKNSRQENTTVSMRINVVD